MAIKPKPTDCNDPNDCIFVIGIDCIFYLNYKLLQFIIGNVI